jgi:hypothetical protein
MTPEPTPEQLAAELADHEPMALMLRPVTALTLAGLIQLALRHPSLHGQLQEVAAQFLAAVREYFEACPHTLAVLRRGDDPRHDVPVADPTGRVR